MIKKEKILIVTTNLRRDRTKGRIRDPMQPINSLHIGSLLDQARYSLTLYHEYLHGPIEPETYEGVAIVFLSGLQADFDRMRQLSFFFRAQGAVVVAGGNICSLYPDFAGRFFDSVCVGGVENVIDFIKDYEKGNYKKIYYSPTSRIRPYSLDHSLLAKNNINSQLHLIEASRGCDFQCKFCVIPAEGVNYAPYGVDKVAEAIENSLANSPFMSVRNLYPIVWFLDNNFSGDREYMKAVCEMLLKNKRVCSWGALVTQNILKDRELVRFLRRCKCRALFTGLESIDTVILKNLNKSQNLSRENSLIEDIRYAERQGICILYGYLFDPRYSTVREMKSQLDTLINTPGLPLPTYFSFVSPLLGTRLFNESIAGGDLRPGLQLRDMEGEAIAFNSLADKIEDVADFARIINSNLGSVVSPWRVVKSTLKRIKSSKTINPFFWYVYFSGNFRAFQLAGAYRDGDSRTYIAGEDKLDPQYSEYPENITDDEWRMYFEPIEIIDKQGETADWLKAYVSEDEHHLPRDQLKN